MGSRLEKKSNDVRKRIEGHAFDNEEGEEYEASKFGGFGDYMRRKKIKLQNLDVELRARSADNPQIFRNIVVHVNGYTQPSLSDLHNLVVSYGGGFLQYLDGKTFVTHVVASHLTPKKKVEFARYRIVKPAWIVDSVNAGRLLPWENFRVVDEGVTQKVLGFDNGQMVSQASTQKLGYRDQTDTSWYTSHVKDIVNKLDGSADTPENAGPMAPNNLDDEEPQIPTLVESEEVFMSDEDPAQVDADPDLAATKGMTSADSLERKSDLGPLPPLDETVSLTTSESAQALSNVNEGNKEKRQLTAEEHNAILLQNPHLAKSSTANPNFLNQYYRESRLHHLSMWKADLKAQLQARAAERSSQRQKPKRAPGSRRYVMHVDFDSFFAAVSLRNNPQLKDQPVVVAHGSGPGSEIASCNYPARKFGIKNGMWMKYALEVCPSIKVLPYDYKAYEEASKHFYDSILAIDGIVQSISIDEALIDVSDQCLQAGRSDGKGLSEGSIYREQTKADEIGQSLRCSIREKTGCEVSVGIGNNILLAKVALRKAKPAGQHQIKPEDMLDFLAELTVTDLPGVAHSIGKKLEEIGVKYVKDIRTLTKEKLVNTLGPKTGEKIWDYSRGIDKQEVGEQVVRKSVSAEINWGIRFITQQQAEEFVLSLCEELSKRLLDQVVKGKQLTMKIMRKAADAGMDPPKNLGHGKCDTFNKSVVLGVATNDKAILGKEAVSILRSYGFPPGELRGLGVQMQKLEPIKPVASAAPSLVESSQRRLQFKKPALSNPSATRQASPSFAKKSDWGHASNPELPTSPSRPIGHSETVEDFPTPEKLNKEPFVPGAIENQRESDTPLNISGTQFVMPTQIDPSVLAELPADIRAKLAPKPKNRLDGLERSRSPNINEKSRSASPYVSDAELGLPSQSQLDPTALAALPDDMRDEIMAHYRESTKLPTTRPLQKMLPQSSRTGNPISSKKAKLTPTKKQKSMNLIGRGKSKVSNSSLPTLTQSNFVSLAKSADAPGKNSIIRDEDISQSFLDELPSEIRAEILAEQRRNRMKQKSGLNVASSKRKPKIDGKTADVRGQQKLQLPQAPSKPTFTSRKLTDLPDLRTAMSAWVQEFSAEGEEGPFTEDTEALGLFLRRVVLEESDMAKATALIEWLVYIVNDWPFERPSIRDAWTETISLLKDTVQLAVQERGLPPIHFTGS